VIDRDGTDLGVMMVAEAQKLAAEEGAELFVADRITKPPVVRIVTVRKMKME
jgi:translation initiation factor IF-3